MDDRAYDSYVQYLNEAKDRLLICLERLEYDKVIFFDILFGLCR